MYTIVVDEDDRKRQTENRINAAFRHCRIGRVGLKLPQRWATMKPTGWYPYTGSPKPHWPFPLGQGDES
ncbi:hypothetical protein GOD68_18185 [Sinorhizobium medicae]|nr:hypothetical protein [Sinorhizobium medicae]